MAYESFDASGPERIPDEDIIGALRANAPGLSDLLIRWHGQSQARIDRIYESEGPEAKMRADIRASIDRAVIYHRAGRVSDAVLDMKEAVDALSSAIFEGSDLRREAESVLSSMEAGETV